MTATKIRSLLRRQLRKAADLEATEKPLHSTFRAMLRVFHKGRCFIKQLQEQFQAPGVETLWPVEGLGGQGDGCAGEVPLVVEFAGVLEYLVPDLPDVVQRQVCGQVHLDIRVMPGVVSENGK